MSDEESFLNVFKRILDGEKVTATINDWHVSNFSSRTVIDLDYKNSALYGFFIQYNKEILILDNYHREAQKGMGTPTLKYMEKMFKYIAKILKITIILRFPTFNQPDTPGWLEKNKYKLEEGVYVKTIN